MSIQITVPLKTLTLRLGGRNSYWLGDCVIKTPNTGHLFGAMIPDSMLSSSGMQVSLRPRSGDLMDQGETYDEAIYLESIKRKHGQEYADGQDIASLRNFEIGGQRCVSAKLIVREKVYRELDAILRSFACRNTLLQASIHFDGFASDGRNEHMPTVEQFVEGTGIMTMTQIEFILGMAENAPKIARGTEMEPETPT